MSKPDFTKADQALVDKFAEVAHAVLSERKYQIRRWSSISPKGNVIEHGHEVGAFLTLLRDQLDKAQTEWASSAQDDKALYRIRNIAAIAFACMEQHGVSPRPLNVVTNARSSTVILED